MCGLSASVGNLLILFSPFGKNQPMWIICSVGKRSEIIITAQLNREGVHVYVAKVRPLMKIETDEGKEHYDLWFVLERRRTN